jgi:hypothetical protein
MKINATLEELIQTSTTTRQNKYRVSIEAIGDKASCQKIMNQIASLSPNQPLDSGTKRSYSGNPDNNPRKNIDIFHAPMF